MISPVEIIKKHKAAIAELRALGYVLVTETELNRLSDSLTAAVFKAVAEAEKNGLMYQAHQVRGGQ